MTKKFKVGDRVKAKIGGRWVEITVTRINSVNDLFGNWLKNGEEEYMEARNCTLVTPAPLTFEVGKRYKLNGTWINNIYTVEFVSPITGTALATAESDGKIISARLEDIKRYSEVVPPPPEEWRALFYKENGKPEVSAATYTSKEACDADYRGPSNRCVSYMYAIRTDINAKKEN